MAVSKAVQGANVKEDEAQTHAGELIGGRCGAEWARMSPVRPAAMYICADSMVPAPA